MKNYKYIQSPLGLIELEATEKGVSGLRFADLPGHEQSPNPVLDDCTQQLDEYFRGLRKEFKLPLDIEGTEFREKIWNELLNIPYGETISYGELARRTGDANAARAAGNANGSNKISIIIPCHRVIASGGKLGGYGGGEWRKKYLLDLEKNNLEGTLNL